MAFTGQRVSCRGRVCPGESGLPLRAVEKCSLRGGLPIPTAPAVRPDDSRHRFGVGMRPCVSRRISGAVARSAPAAFFGTCESRRSRSARLAQAATAPGLRDATSLAGDRCACGGDSWGRRGSSDPADLERRVRAAAKRPAAVPYGGGAVSPLPAEKPGGPTDSGCRANRPSRRRQRQHSPRRDVLPRREWGPRRACLARWGEKREAGAGETRRPVRAGRECCEPLRAL